MENQNYDMIIIGGGPGGLVAALYGARARMNVLLIEKMAPGGQLINTQHVDNYPGFPEGTTGPDLAKKLDEQAKKFGAHLKMGTVKDLNLSGNLKEVMLESGENYTAKGIVVATGASPRELKVPGEQVFTGRGVSYCATCDGAFFKDKEVVVVGGGDSALEEALFLTRFAKKVTLVHRRDQLRGVKYLQEKVFSNEQIEVKLDTVIKEIKGNALVENVLLENVKTQEQQELSCNGVFIYVGVNPNTEFLEGKVNLDDNGYILTDEEMRTNVNGVYAVGDVRQKTLRQVVTAMSDGATAAFDLEKKLTI
ncbi:thioredoxin-disulfide reductase [Natranaerofaba carboxydovora]|uniref:thioredoxin-disulfide reductase n=1 Tax=Natranaerofaba carboxydovora TaxID=2742683 RepID=UPI001F14312B|nr:thioredoxin-disulfide reductase [Natranaerofaba carboxydovora]UMZ72750.1 Thioredoxin reductase [Natranaerofaba carboxydovora]